MAIQDYTPEYLQARKAELREHLNMKKEQLSISADELLRPDEATTRAEQFTAAFSRAFTIADGALMGYRLVKRFGWLLPKKRKKRRRKLS